ncbi:MULTISPECIES: thiamine pyrophosphate-dependent enzyme [unclassified Halomonas]|uniref:thiamine pyrophosphate-dependent enzyme n=1 Tax=unclassified Halomonas TaxID=2609666 RepID=UPI0021E49842|nr:MULTISPECIES: thiamine pyrophosphate-dependent enzyme [unclassified Halomonas]UYG00729.1 thiamine pyrophosphate-binding protein [Halomonas sp. GD1P12]WNL41515.1 thiamine pyrophosphate-binding protein [Halomonas sp. PAMB 3264]
MSKNVAEILVDTLQDAGAKRCYGVVGDSLNHFTDALRTSEIEWVGVRHEEVGGFAAGGEAYMTGELALCAGSCGPGSLHFVNGLFDAHRNNAPVVLIASQIALGEVGNHFPQEVDQSAIFKQYSVFCETIVSAEQAGRTAAMAAQAAIAKRGVAVLIVPGDVMTQKPSGELSFKAHTFDYSIRPSAQALVPAVRELNKGGKITIFAGAGCEDARDQVIALAEKLKAPIAWTSRAKNYIEYDNPYQVGMTGVYGLEGGYHAVAECDTLLLLGCSFAFAQFYPDGANIIQVDHEPTQIGKRYPVDVGIVGTIAETCEALVQSVQANEHTSWLDKCLKRYKKSLEKSAHDTKSNTTIHPQELTLAIDRLSDDNALFTADTGSVNVWMLRHIHTGAQRKTLSSLQHGTMANAYPQAMGIQLAYPGRQVIALCGDGGLSMLMGDLLTLVQRQIPLKIAVYNNQSLSFVELEQKVEGMLDAYTELQNPNFGDVARAIGLWGKRVEREDELDAAVTEWLAQPGPALLDVMTNPMELVMPPKVETGQVAATALYSAKAVLSGRMDEVVHLVKSNFLKR